MKYITTAMLIALAAGCGEELDMNQTFSQGHSVANPSTPAPEKPEQSQDAVRQIPVIEETEEITVADEVIEISPNEITEVFLTEKMEQAIDLMWVLDNSNSMGDEHAKILANFSSFMSEVSGRSKLKMGVISSKGKWGIDLTSYGVEQVDATTGSMTALSLAAASLCDASRSDSNGSGFAKSKVCDRNVSTNPIDSSAIDDVKGEFKGFYRPHAKNIMIVVSDDDASGVDDSNFLDIMHSNNLATDLEFYGFIGKDTLGTCDIARKGSDYMKIAEDTGGATYDLCGNWYSHFEKLIESVLTVRKKPIKLAASPKKVKSVSIDGKTISTDNWELTDGDIIILKGITLEEDAKEIHVSYEW